MGKQKQKKKRPPQRKDTQSSPSAGPAGFRTLLKQKIRSSQTLGRWLEIIAFLLVLAIGFMVRFEDIRDWKAHPEWALYQGEPLIIENDGYRYLRYSRDLLEGTYTPIDDKRNAPHGAKRGFPPPLLSLVAAGCAKICLVSLNWVGMALPPLLGILLAFPVYGLARFYGGPIAGLTAALLSLLALEYLYRSSLGWFDADCMNVTWAMGGVYCFLRFGVETGTRRYFYLAGGFIIGGLFMWWWGEYAPIALIMSLPLAVAVLLFYRPSKKEALCLIGFVALCLVALILWKNLDFFLRLLTNPFIRVQRLFIEKEVTSVWPSIEAEISELKTPSFHEITTLSTLNVPTFIMALAGLAWLVRRFPKEALFLLPVGGLAVIALFFQRRFIIFLSPLTSLGIGFIVAEIWGGRHRFRILTILSPLIAVFLLVPPLVVGMAKSFWPKEPPHLIAGMALAGEKTPPDSIIWAWWDHGYSMQYWARRATISDGGFHGGERSFYNALPFVTTDQRFAANFMQFFARHGTEGIRKVYKAAGDNPARGMSLIKKVLSSGPEKVKDLLASWKLESLEGLENEHDWLTFFFPRNLRPVYLFLNWDLTETIHGWFQLGSWDLEKREGLSVYYERFSDIEEEGDTIKGIKLPPVRETGVRTQNPEAFTIDVPKGEMRVGGMLIPLTQLFIYDGKQGRTKRYERDQGLRFEMVKTVGYGVLMDDHVAESVFNQLFVRHSINPDYFQPVLIKTAHYQLWQVLGDTLPEKVPD